MNPNPVILRNYQLRGFDSIGNAYARGKRAPLYVAPTGSGKTQLLSAIAHGAANKHNRVLILSHRIELIDQISQALSRWEVPHGFVAAGYPKTDAQCMLASVPTLVRRLDSIPEPKLIICDEAHHARAKTFEMILTHWPAAKLLGVTATPLHASGGLGTIFDELILGPTVAELIAEGWLVEPIIYGPQTVDISGLHTRAGEFIASESEELVNTPSITGNALSIYRDKTNGLPALAFCVSVQHARDVAAQFRAGGYSAVALDGGTDREIRRGVVADFRAGKITLIASCELFSEGFDCPGVHVGIMLRPTQSEVIYRQQCGRLLRPETGKKYAYLFDHVRNWERFGLPHWDREEPWPFEGVDRAVKKKAPSIKVCPKCWRALKSAVRRCPDPCGHVFEVKPRVIEERDGELVEITAEEIAKRREKRALAFEQSQASTVEALAEVFKKRGYTGDLKGRARHVLAARAAKKLTRLDG